MSADRERGAVINLLIQMGVEEVVRAAGVKPAMFIEYRYESHAERERGSYFVVDLDDPDVSNSFPVVGLGNKRARERAGLWASAHYDAEIKWARVPGFAKCWAPVGVVNNVKRAVEAMINEQVKREHDFARALDVLGVHNEADALALTGFKPSVFIRWDSNDGERSYKVLEMSDDGESKVAHAVACNSSERYERKRSLWHATNWARENYGIDTWDSMYGQAFGSQLPGSVSADIARLASEIDLPEEDVEDAPEEEPAQVNKVKVFVPPPFMTAEGADFEDDNSGPARLARCPITSKAMRNKGQMEQWIAAYRKRKPKGAPRLYPYQCDYCKAWHMSKTSQALHETRRKMMVKKAKMVW